MNAPYFDMRLGRMVHPGGGAMVPPNPARPVGGEDLGASEGGAGKTLLVLALLGAAGFGAYYLYKQSQEGDGEEIDLEHETDVDDDDAGHWVKLYNYPRGNPDRRLKRVEGPFETKAEAERIAREHEDVWYPVVAWSNVSPLDAER